MTLSAPRMDGLRSVRAVSIVILVSVWLPISSATSRAQTRDPGELLRQGNELIDLGRYEEAEQTLSELVELDPQAALGFADLGRAQALNRRWLRAEKSLRTAQGLGQDDLRTLIYLGSALWENTKFEESEAIYIEAVERFPGSPLPKYQLGRLWLWQGRYDESVPYLRQSAARNPAPDVMLDLAEALRGAGEVDEAIVAYQQVVRNAPDMMKAHYGLALLLQQKGESEQAKRHLDAYYELYKQDQAAARSSELEKGEIDRGRDLIRRDRIPEAIDHLSSLPPTIESLTALADAYAMAKQPERAIESLERAVIMDPGNAELRRRLTEARLAAESKGG